MFSDKQHIKMQETPDAVPEGETPLNVGLCAYEDMVDKVKPGDRVEVVGIYRACPRRLNATMRTVRSIYQTYIDVIGFTKTDAKRFTNEEQEEKRQEDVEMGDEE